MQIIPYKHIHNLLMILPFAIIVLLAVACYDTSNRAEVDRLNDISYSYHYRNLDSTQVYAKRAFEHSHNYGDGRAEAMNNLAFVEIARMKYAKAFKILTSIPEQTDNQIEQLVCDVQLMRLCQRRSENKNFYHYLQHAQGCLKRLNEDEELLDERQRARLVYARSEYAIVYSAYLYYLGQLRLSTEALMAIDAGGEVVRDTAQLLAYYYNVGSGGILSGKTHERVVQAEFDNLMRCYLLSRQYRYQYWEANSLQAISEHLQNDDDRQRLTADNMQEIDFINVDQMPDSLLSGNLAQRALSLFEAYGDVYQTAGAWRTLSMSYRNIGDYNSAYACLTNALEKDTAINAAPDLVASIREQMSIVCSAMGDKPRSDYNRNIYLDLQERTRQDRQLEARAEQLSVSLRQLDFMIVAVMVLIAIIIGLLSYFGYQRHKQRRMVSTDRLLAPLEEWKQKCEAKYEEKQEEIEEIEDETNVKKSQKEHYGEISVEQRTKILIASSVIPLINRLTREFDVLTAGKCTPESRNEHLAYAGQLVDSIAECNQQLTKWIRLKQGGLQLNIKSFMLKDIFDVIRRNASDYKRHGITLHVEDNDTVVKADPVLTLFMVNTIAENARRYTPQGGEVKVSAEETDDYVEISIADNGSGMAKEQLDGLFTRKIIKDSSNVKAEGEHGFGLINCKGIIDKYRKTSSIFSVCSISAESEAGKGSRFFFRLPKGIHRVLTIVAMLVYQCVTIAASTGHLTNVTAMEAKARAYADSAYNCNINGQYERTIIFADSCICLLNKLYPERIPNASRRNRLMTLNGDYPAIAAELQWFRDSVKADYGTILDVRNETAVAALALRNWSLYSYNNAVYIQLFRDCSADNTIATYVRTMQQAESNRSVAMIMLIVMFVSIFPAYYLLYYRHRVYYRLCIGKIADINRVLLDDTMPSEEKLNRIDALWPESTETKLSKRMADRRPKELHDVVKAIRNSVSSDLNREKEMQVQLEIVRDQLRRQTMECDRLYVSNSVVDNCLSSLKHETMYYPSRIRQVLDNGELTAEGIVSLRELALYYRMLYMALINQTVHTQYRIGSTDEILTMMNYMFAIIKRKNGGVAPGCAVSSYGNSYAILTMTLDKCATRPDSHKLFTPYTDDFDYLVCCQIMRDIGDFTGMRGSGIQAYYDAGAKLVIRMFVPQTILEKVKMTK
ncbi:sensor histidine kinase [Prevotella sp.]|uniref:sensor histidine kinase n=1 Tax=Prevotella sp. TaxID=59823 RepID=UPI0025EE2B80|nr:DUF5112 domain-containing protein [Prevotella sp.]MCI7372086.1 DUF5112 domain-containing protein [Prevotella sp.]